VNVVLCEPVHQLFINFEKAYYSVEIDVFYTELGVPMKVKVK
jgi:hypothetical protein